MKDALSLLRVLENPFDEVSWFRVLQLPEGVGPATARRLMDELGVRRVDDDQPSPLLRFLEEPVAVPKAAVDRRPGAPRGARRLPGGRDGHAACRAARPHPHVPRAGVRAALRRRGARGRDLEQLELLASGYETRGRFVSELTLDPPSSTGDLAGPPLLDEDWLVLSTIHSAKGLEWDVVHVIHAADGMIPSDMATGDDDEIEEERRLLYVAMTRARDALIVSFPQRYYRRPRGLEDPHSYAQLTRFLPDQVRVHFDEVAPDVIPLPDADAIDGTADVDAFLAGLWAD